MNRVKRSLRQVAARQDGFALVEVVVSAAMLSIAIFALLSSISLGFAGIDVGRKQSTAVFLAEQRLEEARAFALGTAAGQGWANLVTNSFPAEAYGAIANYPWYRRTFTVTDNPGGNVDTKLVEARVFYRPQTESGMSAETSVVISTLISRR
jgi:type II secretory pathway pseudopilin PulG